MKNINTYIRTLLGLLIIISGANKFGNWINVNYMHDAMDFVVKLTNIGGGFIITMIAVVEIILGLSLITNKYTTISVLILLPLMVSILLFHLVLDLNGIGVALLVFAMVIYLFFTKRDKISALLT